jgi:hypothetical protein
MCIAEALRAGSPFYVWFWLNPVDSFPASGLLLNANQELFVAWYDGGYGMFRRTVFDTTKCAQWELDPAAELKITCQIPDRQSVYLFAMESFVDIDGAP